MITFHGGMRALTYEWGSRLAWNQGPCNVWLVFLNWGMVRLKGTPAQTNAHGVQGLTSCARPAIQTQQQADLLEQRTVCSFGFGKVSTYRLRIVPNASNVILEQFPGSGLDESLAFKRLAAVLFDISTTEMASCCFCWLIFIQMRRCCAQESHDEKKDTVHRASG